MEQTQTQARMQYTVTHFGDIARYEVTHDGAQTCAVCGHANGLTGMAVLGSLATAEGDWSPWQYFCSLQCLAQHPQSNTRQPLEERRCLALWGTMARIRRLYTRAIGADTRAEWDQIRNGLQTMAALMDEIAEDLYPE